MANYTLSVLLTGNSAQLSSTLSRAARDVDGFGKTSGQSLTAAGKQFDTFGARARAGGEQMQNLGRGLAIGGAAVAVAFGAAANASMKFEAEMSNVAAVSGASASEMRALSDAALAAGASTTIAGVTARDAAAAEAELVRAGVSVADTLGGALTGSLTLAAAGQLDFAAAATIAAQAMNIFKLAGSDVEHIADVLAAAANKSATDVGQLGDALRQGGLVAAQAGLSLEETVGALAAFGDSALIGSDAGTSLKTMLQRLIPQSEEAANLMGQLGFEAFDAGGNFIGLEGLAGELRTSLGGLTVEQRNSALATLFGSDAVRGATVLYEQGAAGIRGYVDAVNDEGAAAEMAAIQNDNLKGDIEALGGVMETVFIETGGQANGALRGLVQTATDVVTGFSLMSDGMKGGTAVVVGLTGAVSLLGGGFILLAPKVVAAKTALEHMGRPGAAVAANLGLIGKAAGVAGIALTGMTWIAQRHAAALQRGRDSVEGLTDGLAGLSVMAARTELDRVRAEAESAAAAFDEMNSVARVDNNVARFLDEITGRTDDLGEVEGAALAAADAYAAIRVEGRNLAGNLNYLGYQLDLSEAELMRLADTAGVDLTGAIQDVVPAINEAYEAMAGGLTDSQRLTMSLEEQAEASEAQAAAAEEAAQAIIDANTAMGDSFGAFTDPLSAFEAALARKEEVERASAEATAAATEDSSDSWEDYYDEQSLNMADYIAEMQAQVDAQDNWATNLATIAQRGREDVALQMAAMGPESAAAAAAMASAVDSEFQVGADLWVRTAGDGGLQSGEAFEQGIRFMAAYGRQGASATAYGIGEELGIGAGQVLAIASQYGVNLARGINPVLAGIGKPTLSIGGILVEGGLRRAMGGPVPGVGSGDTVPAMLTPGEFVIRKAAVAKVGVDALEDLNWIDRRPPRGYAAGGFVTAGDVPGPPDVSRYGTAVGYSGGEAMDHLGDATRAFVTANAAPAMTGGSTTGLVPSFLAAFNQLNAALGGIYRITSGFRSREQQAALYARWMARVPGQAPAAPPGRSNHERGLAIDHSPHSNASRRATAAKFGLRYPMSYEPWHIEPVGIRDKGGPLMPGLTWNGTGAPEMVLPMTPQRFAAGGLVASMFPGGGGGERPDDWSMIQAARGVGQYGDNDYRARLYERLATYRSWSAEWTEAYRELTAMMEDEEQERVRIAEEAAEAAEADYQRRRSINDNLYELGLVSTAFHLGNLEIRMAREEMYSDAWLALYEERADIIADAAKAEADAQQEALDTLVDLIEEERGVRARMVTAARDHAADLVEIDRGAQQDRRQVIEDRVDDLANWMDAEERFVRGWGNTAGALTDNLAAQAEAFASWAAELDEARARGLSEDTIDMLGLDQGPQALAQLQALNGATVAEVDALNAAVADRRRLAAAATQREQAQSFSVIGSQLADIAERHRDAITEAQAQFAEDQAGFAEDLAAIGEESGMSFGAALAAGLTSQVPAVRAAAAALQSAAAQITTSADIAAIFARHGVSGTFGTMETAAARFARIAAQVNAGRSLQSVNASVLAMASNPGGYQQFASGGMVQGSGAQMAVVHGGERVFSQVDNARLISAIQQPAVVHNHITVVVDGKEVAHTVRKTIGDMNRSASFAGAR